MNTFGKWSIKLLLFYMAYQIVFEYKKNLVSFK